MKLITVDDIYNVVKKTYKNKPFTLREAIDKTAQAKKIKPDSIIDQYGSLYTELSQDPLFKLAEGKNWKLTEFMTLNAQEEITEKLYDKKGNEVYEEGFAPLPELEEGEEIALDEEYEFFDEDDDEDNVIEKQKQLTDTDDYEEMEELEIEKEKEK